MSESLLARLRSNDSNGKNLPSDFCLRLLSSMLRMESKVRYRFLAFHICSTYFDAGPKDPTTEDSARPLRRIELQPRLFALGRVGQDLHEHLIPEIYSFDPDVGCIGIAQGL